MPYINFNRCASIEVLLSIRRLKYTINSMVEQGYESNGLFWKHNLKLIQEIEMLEHKTRRQDILINDDVLYQFYDERIDEKIVFHTLDEGHGLSIVDLQLKELVCFY